MKTKISGNILIVEDHPIFRMGMKDMINSEPDLSVCAEAEDVEPALGLVASYRPDLAIVDLSLKNSSGFDLVCQIHENYSFCRTLVLSMHDEALHAERCLLAGAKGYLMKQEASESVVSAIRSILNGQIHVSSRIMSRLLNVFTRQPTPEQASPLAAITDRELEIFKMIGCGLTSKEIAMRLNISIKTVGTYRERIKEKLHLKNASTLIRHAAIWVETGVFKGDE
ncbi:response regulator transcription factor [uncultured Desulfobacter sp.]|uniref:response regulator transcription factor n=1 Tax=uncultured Desulfobacter sp. TaxID=240139 RepID=UPI002AAB13B5|nr:response regulator transcription factor [uncultured Desulfobacter sp.]